MPKGMTYKNSLAGLSHGGGKAVIIGDPKKEKTPQLLQAFARCVNRLGSRYITGEDSNISIVDISAMSKATPHVRNLPLDETGDPSVFTAWGVCQSMKVALLYKSGIGMNGVAVPVEGLGGVGMELCRWVRQAGAALFVPDTDPHGCFGAQSVSVGRLHAAIVDVYAHCALGGGLNTQTITELKPRVIAELPTID